MVLFGAPVSRADDVKRAIACAVEMQLVMHTLNLAHKEQGMPELYMGIGINTGDVLAGMLGSEHYSDGLKVPRQEIRRSHRVQVKLPFNYRVIDDGIVLPENHTDMIRDIGYYGILIETERLLPLYAEIKLDFNLPLLEYQVQDVYAKIVGQKPQHGCTQMGVEFTSVSAETNMKIQLFVQLLIFTDLN